MSVGFFCWSKGAFFLTLDENSKIKLIKKFFEEMIPRDFPGGAVVENPPASAGDTGSIPGPGGSHMPRSS